MNHLNAICIKIHIILPFELFHLFHCGNNSTVSLVRCVEELVSTMVNSFVQPLLEYNISSSFHRQTPAHKMAALSPHTVWLQTQPPRKNNIQRGPPLPLASDWEQIKNSVV